MADSIHFIMKDLRKAADKGTAVYFAPDAVDALEAALGQPEPEGPTDEELMQFLLDSFRGPIEFICDAEEEAQVMMRNHIKFARAVLARWGRQTPQPEPEGPIDGPAVQSREPASVMEEPSDEAIESWADASKDVPGEFLDPDSGRWERCLSSEEFCATVRAALAFWGQP